MLQLPDVDATVVAVSRQSRASAGRLAVVAAGLAIELSGLAPAAGTPISEIAHWYGYQAKPAMASAEAISANADVRARSGDVLAQVRAMAAVACRLTRLDHVDGVVWHPARSAVAPAAFVTTVGAWLNGGPFPALGLTALFRDDHGTIRSEGLAFFTGQEVYVQPQPSKSTGQDAKIAVRLINHLVGGKSINQRFEIMGPDGEQLCVEPPDSDGFIRIWRRS